MLLPRLKGLVITVLVNVTANNQIIVMIMVTLVCKCKVINGTTGSSHVILS